MSNVPINSPPTLIELVGMVYSYIDIRKICVVAITALKTIPLNVDDATFESE